MNERVCTVASDIIDSISDVLRKHEVTFEEYRAGFRHLIAAAENHEVGLLLDMFFNQTICDIEMKSRQGTRSNVEGPYFLEDAPWVTDSVQVCGNTEPLRIRGQVRDTAGNPVPDVEVDLWWANPDGTYSGYSDDLPKKFFRGKLKTDAEGRYDVMGSMPIEYPMTSARHGPTGELISMLGRQGMRTKHVHQKYRKEGYHPLTTQAYFSGAAYIDEDPVKAVFDDLTYDLQLEGDVPVLEIETVLDSIAA